MGLRLFPLGYARCAPADNGDGYSISRALDRNAPRPCPTSRRVPCIPWVVIVTNRAQRPTTPVLRAARRAAGLAETEPKPIVAQSDSATRLGQIGRQDVCTK